MSILLSSTSGSAIIEYWRQQCQTRESSEARSTDMVLIRKLTTEERVSITEEFPEGDATKVWFGGFDSNGKLMVLTDDYALLKAELPSWVHLHESSGAQ